MAGFKFKEDAITSVQNFEHQPVQILVVEDFEPYRTHIISLLRENPGLRVIGEVADGLQAVQRAQELSPDLILLDIGLPGLNGIEAAREILQLVPKAKILFLTQETSADLVREALKVGACGYVVKSQAGRELLAAIEVVLQGKRFVSSGLGGHESATTGGHGPDPDR
jgi:DNA-binding NarL/FixJ family response regulator